MRRPQYPLEPLAYVRERQVDDAVRGLANAVSQREAAARRARVVEQAAESHAVGVDRVKRAERPRSRTETCSRTSTERSPI